MRLQAEKRSLNGNATIYVVMDIRFFEEAPFVFVSAKFSQDGEEIEIPRGHLHVILKEAEEQEVQLMFSMLLDVLRQMMEDVNSSNITKSLLLESEVTTVLARLIRQDRMELARRIFSFLDMDMEDDLDVRTPDKLVLSLARSYDDLSDEEKLVFKNKAIHGIQGAIQDPTEELEEEEEV